MFTFVYIFPAYLRADIETTTNYSLEVGAVLNIHQEVKDERIKVFDPEYY